KLNQWTDIGKIASKDPLIGFVRNMQSKVLYAVKQGPPRTMESGEVVDTFRRIGPRSTDIVPKRSIRTSDQYRGGRLEEANYEEIQNPTETMWDEQLSRQPKTTTSRDTYVVGAFLPIWDRLKLPSPKIWRVRTDDGETFLGAHVPPDAIGALRSRLGA